MNDKDFQALLAAIERADQEITTPEQARQVLQDEGYLDETGALAEPYTEAR